nr:malto-oligosyltrehalose synthase [Candidatus Omnitrophota bacterium]
MSEQRLNAGHEPQGTNLPLKIFSEEKLRTLICRKIKAVFIPSSVYRIQLNREFTFRHAIAMVPYLNELGIEAVYCSPYFQASPGSMHGYNVTDPTRINPEIGSTEDYELFCSTLAHNGLGQIADVVPNHMGITGNNNPWWNDVLENGPSSLYARYFDIDWRPIKQELWGKVLLPVLGNFYGRVLENQDIQLMYRKGEFFLAYFDHRFPVDPKTYPVILEDEAGELVKKMGQENQDYLEYLSVITAFKNLPPTSDIITEKMVERSREKEIAKQRLEILANRCEDIKRFIESRILIFNGNKTDSKSFDPMDQFLNLQPYRLAFWSVASQEINYRRFFDINELAAIRIEDEKVFKHYHELLFNLIKEGKIHGLRIDHPDGLYDPPVYFRRLQREYLVQMVLKEEEISRAEIQNAEQVDVDILREALERLLANEFFSLPAFYVVAEKILDRRESLPENWNIHGTVGYDYLNAANGLFVNAENEKAFAKLYEDYIGHGIDFDELVYNKKKFIGLVPMASEINALGHRLDRISETNRKYRDFTRNDLTVAIREVIAGFPVYRTYISPGSTSVSEKDEKYIRIAVAKARKKTPALNPAVYDFLRDVLLLRLNVEPGSEEEELYQDFLLRFQQQTSPIMAKGVEDTSFYIYNRLISLNEVGGDPFYFGYTKKDFHEHNLVCSKRWPYSMITTSTHDTKRSEDARMRINVLSEIPDEWKSKISEWSKFNQGFKTTIEGVSEPRKNTEYFIYQTLIGVWPDEPLTAENQGLFIERIWQYVLKSIREAKIYTNWTQPNTEYEEAVNRFIHAIFAQGTSSDFWKNFVPFQKRIAFFGKFNSLSATLLKISSSGVVDIYQGNETWNYALVDPDNRQCVNFETRKRILNSIKKKTGSKGFGKFMVRSSGEEDLEELKLFYTWKGLCFRRQHKDLFVDGEYIPVEIVGPRENNVVAFIRKRGKQLALVVAGRFFTGWPMDKSANEDSYFWNNTELIWPEGLEVPKRLRDVIISQMVDVVSSKQTAVIKVSDLFQKSCAAILTNIEE